MNTKQKILYEALELFSIYGYGSVSISQITNKVGIAKSSLYTHFSSKEDILDAVYQSYLKIGESQRLTEEEILHMIEKQSPAEFWQGVQQQYFNRWKNPFMVAINRFLVMEQFRNPAAKNILVKETQSILDMTTFIFKMMSRMGKIRIKDAEPVAEAYVYAIRGMMMELDVLKAHGSDTRQIEKRIGRFIDEFCSKITL